jgi:hypothetical protein
MRKEQSSPPTTHHAAFQGLNQKKNTPDPSPEGFSSSAYTAGEDVFCIIHLEE